VLPVRIHYYRTELRSAGHWRDFVEEVLVLEVEVEVEVEVELRREIRTDRLKKPPDLLHVQHQPVAGSHA